MAILTFGISIGAIILRYTRSSVLEVLGEDYIRTARAKGLSPARVIFIHALKNTLMIPIVTSVGIWTAFIIGATVLIEEIFDPGCGPPGAGRDPGPGLSNDPGYRSVPVARGLSGHSRHGPVGPCCRSEDIA